MSARRSRSAKDRPRILYVINDLDTGGAQRVLFHQSSHLDRSRFSVRVASLELIPNGKLIPDFEHAGLRLHQLRSAKEPWLVGWGRLGRLMRTYRPTLVHTHLASAGVFGRVLARRCGVERVVSTFHNLSDWQENHASPVRWLDRQTLPKADTLVAVSEAVREAMVRSRPKLADRIVTVHNGVPLSHAGSKPELRAATRRELGYDSKDFVIGSAARLDPRKGLDTLIEAFSMARLHYPNLRLLIVGDGPERERLEGLVARLELEAQVQLLTNRSPIAPYLMAMDLFAAPSRTEGLGVAVIEALAMGLPIIASNVGGIPEVVEDGKCGRLLPPDRIDLWAENLSDLVSMRDVLERWSNDAPRYAGRFSLEASSARLAQVYDELLGEEAGGQKAMAA